MKDKTKTIRFDNADVFSWKDTYDEFIQEAVEDPSDIASFIAEVLNKHSVDIAHSAGDVHGAHGPVGLYIYTMEDDDWIYVAHFIYEVDLSTSAFYSGIENGLIQNKEK